MNDMFDNTRNRSNDYPKEYITKILATLNFVSNDRVYNIVDPKREYTYEDLLTAHNALLILMYDLRGFSEMKEIGFKPQEDKYINVSKKYSGLEVQEILDAFEETSLLENALIKNLNDLYFEGRISSKTGEYEIVDYAKSGKLLRPREETESSLEEAAYVVSKIIKLRKQKYDISRPLRRFRIGSGVVGFEQYKRPATKVPKLAISKAIADLYEIYDSEDIVIEKMVSK